MTVRSLSQMFKPGTIGASADCDTCGDKGGKPTVTRVALENMAKINRGVKSLKVGVTADEAVEVSKEFGKALANAAPAPRGRKKKESEPVEEQPEQKEVEND